ncbi:MAG: helix-turn-helix domain-containing protein [Coriobacteriales bacterium]|jgi:excisionase family DNA binding protein|nr:helix-turn-helix domain-containing protein [Coriobacteriales bacterium]
MTSAALVPEHSNSNASFQEREKLFSDYPEVMSVRQVAEALCVHPNYVREMLLQNIIKGKKVGYKWRILRCELRDWMLEGRS